MRKHLRDVERSSVLGAQFHGHTFEIGWGTLTKVNDDIKDSPRRATRELHFGGGKRLEMHSSDSSTVPAQRNAALHKGSNQSVLRKFPRTKCSSEKSALILAQ